MAQTPVRALPVFLASATAVSVFMFAVRPRIAQRQLEAVRAAETVEVSTCSLKLLATVAAAGRPSRWRSANPVSCLSSWCWVGASARDAPRARASSATLDAFSWCRVEQRTAVPRGRRHAQRLLGQQMSWLIVA